MFQVSKGESDKRCVEPPLKFQCFPSYSPIANLDNLGSDFVIQKPRPGLGAVVDIRGRIVGWALLKDFQSWESKVPPPKLPPQ